MRQGPRTVHVISKKKLIEAARVHGDLEGPLEVWYLTAKAAVWGSLEDVRRQLPSTDRVGDFTVFDIKGNHYRLISQIYYQSQTLLIRHVLTHAEYDKEGWKK
jgi:mRNA interferase HigB